MGVAVLALVAMLCGLVAIYPYRPASPLVWVVFYLAWLPLMSLAELLVCVMFENKLLARLGAASRVIYGVFVMLVLVGLWFAGAAYADFLKPFFGIWGS